MRGRPAALQGQEIVAAYEIGISAGVQPHHARIRDACRPGVSVSEGALHIAAARRYRTSSIHGATAALALVL
jgi:hypothetical protein